MMDNPTKNNLDAEEAKVDYEALVRTARIALYNTITNMERYLRNIQDPQDSTMMYMNASWAKREAEQLAVCADTLAVLVEGAKRKIVLVNLPEK